MSEADNPRQTAIRTINAALASAGRPPLEAAHSILTPDLEGIAAALLYACITCGGPLTMGPGGIGCLACNPDPARDRL